VFTSLKKHRQFDLQRRLGDYSHIKTVDDKRIEFKRLPRKRIKSIWWSVVAFAVLLYFFFYLANY